MDNNVYANGRKIACKKAVGKSICAFPDVCITSPEKLAATLTGTPVPYPNTGSASGLTDGSKDVKINNREIALKNRSYFKKSEGSGTDPTQRKGILTRTNRGKTFFNMWSMNVKIEGLNIVRHLDITTHNHGSFPGNTPACHYVDEADVAADHSGMNASTEGDH